MKARKATTRRETIEAVISSLDDVRPLLNTLALILYSLGDVEPNPDDDRAAVLMLEEAARRLGACREMLEAMPKGGGSNDQPR